MSLAPFVASPPEVVRKMLEVAGAGPSDVVIDLGCGDARMLVTAVTEFGAKMAIGYELREDLYKSDLRLIESKNLLGRVRLVNADLQGADLSEATVITLYLTSTANEKLKPKFEREARPGTRIVSHDFSMNGWRATRIERFNGHTIYLYVLPEAYQHGGHTSVKESWRFWR
ncbi:MAG: SAM-dependent methyltransferase [Candidatus Bathyarchaeia archaeon]